MKSDPPQKITAAYASIIGQLIIKKRTPLCGNGKLLKEMRRLGWLKRHIEAEEGKLSATTQDNTN